MAMVDETNAMHAREGLKEPITRVDCTVKYRVTPICSPDDQTGSLNTRPRDIYNGQMTKVRTNRKCQNAG